MKKISKRIFYFGAMLQDGTLKPKDLILYYYDESVEDWVEETTARWKKQDETHRRLLDYLKR